MEKIFLSHKERVSFQKKTKHSVFFKFRNLNRVFCIKAITNNTSKTFPTISHLCVSFLRITQELC